MSIEFSHRDGFFESRWRPESEWWERLLWIPASLVGGSLLFTPVLFTKWHSGLSLASMLTALLLLLWVGYRLLRAASGQCHRRLRLHVASGELEVVYGRRPFSSSRALGAVEIDRLDLGRGGAPGVFSIAAFVHGGPPVTLIPGDRDEASCREVALVLAQGMGVPLFDRRYPDPEAKKDAPIRVGCTGDGRRTVYRWRYLDRFHPRLVLLGLGIVTGLSSVLPLLAEEIGSAMILAAVLDTLLALLLAAHTLAALTERRLVLRSDALRVERHLGPIRLKQSLVDFDSLSGIVVLRRGMWCAVFLRLVRTRTGVVLPFEEFEVAAWLKSTLETAVHGVGQRRMSTARPGGAF